MMNNWQELGNKFIKQKRYLGYKYRTDSIVIKSITTFLETENVTDINKDVVDKYVRLNLNISSNTLARNIGVFREFNKYLNNQDIKCYQIPLKIYQQHQREFIPHIFSKDEIKMIIKNSYKIKLKYYSYKKEQTIPIIFKILYQTGMRVGEVLNLKIKDYKEQEYFLVEHSKNDEERIIYLPKSLNEEILKYYLKFHYNKEQDEYFFQIRNGKISNSTVDKWFYSILKMSKIKRSENSPRVHDLRHTHIVHCIEKWLKEKKDINVMLPVLQTYVGHSSIKSLEYYFQITQNMINEIGRISEKKLGNIIPELKDGKEDE